MKDIWTETEVTRFIGQATNLFPPWVLDAAESSQNVTW